MSIPGARRLRELFDLHGVSPAKALGQNFVVDPNTVRKMVEVADVTPADRVLEIGAGGGSLTAALAERAGRVIAVEVDRRLMPVLAEIVPGENVEVVAGDALALDLGSFGATKLVGNLPYNIATPLVLKTLREAPEILTLTVMTQREAGERLASPPGSRTYGSASVMVAFWGRAEVVSKVSRNAFFPVPNVDSVIVRVDRFERADRPDAGSFEKVVRAAFSQRRKNLRNCLTGLAGGAEAADAAIARAGLDPSARAETIGVEGFIALEAELR